MSVVTWLRFLIFTPYWNMAFGTNTHSSYWFNIEVFIKSRNLRILLCNFTSLINRMILTLFLLSIWSLRIRATLYFASRNVPIRVILESSISSGLSILTSCHRSFSNEILFCDNTWHFNSRTSVFFSESWVLEIWHWLVHHDRNSSLRRIISKRSAHRIVKVILAVTETLSHIMSCTSRCIHTIGGYINIILLLRWQ